MQLIDTVELMLSDDYKEDISLDEEITMNVNENYLIDKK